MDPDDLVALHLRIDGIVKKIMKIVIKRWLVMTETFIYLDQT